MAKNRYKHLAFIVLTVLLVLIISFLGAEIILRLAGRGSWKTVQLPDEPTMHEFDSVLGWKNKPGEYNYTIDRKKMKATFWYGGLRATQARREERPRCIVLVGGSFTQGYELLDDETFAWKLQERYPSIEFLNYGTGGYSTYQCLLVLERFFKESKRKPLAVLYGFIDDHENRNVAPWLWLKILSELSKREHVYLPYCTVSSDGELIRRSPEGYSNWPFKKWSAVVTFLEERYMLSRTKGRLNGKRRVTKKLFREMKALARRNGSELIVVFLWVKEPQKSIYLEFLKKEGIRTIDATHPKARTPLLTVPGGGHPNEILNSYYAAWINTELGSDLKGKVGFSEAIKHYNGALELSPDYAQAHNSLGLALHRKGKLDEAVKHYLRALQIDPKCVRAHNNIGNVLAVQGKLSEAVKHYKQALLIDPDYAKAHYNLGNVFLKQGRPDDAAGHYQDALRIDPDYQKVRNKLNEVLKKY